MADEPDALELREDQEGRVGGTWRNCTIASWEALLEASGGNARAFVWPDEGRFKRTGSFEFNADHQGFQPLLIDKISADMIRALHDALQKPENQAKLREWIGKCRGHFAKIWELTQERVTIMGFRAHNR
ncbi:hypothetical protein [Chelatococcus asaccharovorans]|uniref:Uncharacterized protein n=1 Tax=Chelatococcus asaccharovorans TaxID=28210 RepID=A0A2V3UAR4_9HYPH|nr:hypothetical protein [Chelatococcus asaccharovorans]MBS7703282.1 hypothetical protein [Chelatococcus asaccharovorans]PXW61614.1 hypothetical protein C7450_103131 [Chelatococcus asaccharovorans]